MFFYEPEGKSAGELREILSSARARDVPVSLRRTGVSGPLVSVAVTSSSAPQMVSDVHSPDTAVIIDPSPSISSSSVPSSLVSFSSVSCPFLLSDFPLLLSTRTSEPFLLFHVL